MRFNTIQQQKEPVGAQRCYRVEEPAREERGPIVGEVELLKTPRSILVRSHLQTSARLTCCRCLGEFTQPLALDFEEEYFPTLDVATGSPLTLPEEAEGAFTIDAQHEVDLEEAVRQYFILALPAKPLCRPQCQGLCSTCGADLNQGPCRCPAPPLDPRWEPLMRLLTRKE